MSKDAVSMLEGGRTRDGGKWLLTLQELLASIFLVKCLVDNRSGKIIDHKFKDRLDLLLCVTSIVRQSRVLR